MQLPSVGTVRSGALFYRGQTAVGLPQMNGVAWRASRFLPVESEPGDGFTRDPDLNATGYDLLGGEGYKYALPHTVCVYV
jgi:hypothetical protein